MAGPYASITSPYAPNHLDSALRIADLIGQQGRSAAQAKYAKRMMVGDLVSGIGGTVGGIFAARDQQKQQAAENQQVADMIASGQPLDLAKLVQAFGVPRAKEIYTFVEAALAKQQAASESANAKGLNARHADALKQGADPAAINIERWGEGAPLLPAQMVPDPKIKAEAEAKARQDALRAQAMTALETATPEQARKIAQDYYAATKEPLPGVVMPPQPPAPEKPPELGSFSDHVGRYAKRIGKDPKDLTDKDIEAARRGYNQSDDRARATPSIDPAKVALFNRLAAELERSPLTRAADRTVTLKSAIRDIRADPANATNQMALSYGYIQALDTYQSAVREGELSNLQNLGSIFEGLMTQVMRIRQGAVVPPEVAKQIAENAERMTAAIEEGRNAKLQLYARRARVSGVGDLWDQLYPETAQPKDGGAPAGGGAPGGGGGTTPGTETTPADVQTRLMGNNPQTGKPYPDGIYTFKSGTVQRKWRKLNGAITEVK